MAVTLQTVNYFPTTSTDYTQLITSDPQELVEFANLYNEIAKVQNLLSETNLDFETNRNALAFLVAITRQMEPQEWLSRLEEIKQRVQELSQQQNPAAEVSYFINNLVRAGYEKSLENRQLQRQLRVLSGHIALYESNHRKGQAISFGAIALDDVPRWLPSAR